MTTYNQTNPAVLKRAPEPSALFKLGRELTRNKYLYIMILPVVIYYLLFCYTPMYGIIIAFKRYEIAKGILESPWVGFKHFIDFYSSVYFWRLIKNTFLISFYDLALGFPAPIIFALLLNEIKSSAFKRTVQTITYLPYFISLVVICGMITDFFSNSGVITRLTAMVNGGRVINYLGEARFFRSIYVGTNIWQNVGWGTIIYLAALSAIPQEQYEAAKIDGAGRLRQTLHVTLPGIMSTIIILLILRAGQIMSVGFEKIILLYNPATYETADVISSFVYRRGLGEGFQYSYSAAVGFFQSVINFVLLLAANRLSKKFSGINLM
jgi:putative aldouronate transport system permease protein